jgi:hypothetical protein
MNVVIPQAEQQCGTPVCVDILADSLITRTEQKLSCAGLFLEVFFFLILFFLLLISTQ